MNAVLCLPVNDVPHCRYIQTGRAPFAHSGRTGPVVVASYYAAHGPRQPALSRSLSTPCPGASRETLLDPQGT
jgi:hypothetical protein